MDKQQMRVTYIIVVETDMDMSFFLFAAPVLSLNNLK